MTGGPRPADGLRPSAAAPPVEGIVPVLKPPGMTSHDVVDACRRLFGIRRVGHAGTLDPAAAGVLLVCLGTSTRLADYLSDAVKAYRAEIWLGVATDSHDSEGRLTDRRPEAETGPALDEARLRAALARRRGPQLQVPPAVSAVHQQGDRAYRRHREGRPVELPPRPVTIHRLELLAWWPGPFPRLLVDVVCSKGTYVRALARDLGADLGRPATLAALIRTAQGPFGLAEAVTLEELARAAAAGEGWRYARPPARALAFWPAWVLDDADARRVVHGGRPRPRPHPWDEPAHGSEAGAAADDDPEPAAGTGDAPTWRVRLLDRRGRLLAVARLERRGASWRAIPERVLHGGGAGSPPRRG
ncbi:MAG TPA: tRNA pseudouridine(55) synthase TruB [Thermaerobacter sp.]